VGGLSQLAAVLLLYAGYAKDFASSAAHTPDSRAQVLLAWDKDDERLRRIMARFHLRAIGPAASAHTHVSKVASRSHVVRILIGLAHVCLSCESQLIPFPTDGLVPCLFLPTRRAIASTTASMGGQHVAPLSLVCSGRY